jgi:hypothetical protein
MAALRGDISFRYLKQFFLVDYEVEVFLVIAIINCAILLYLN